MASQVFYVEYEVRPLPENERRGEVGGAFVICFVRAQDAEQAGSSAAGTLVEMQWEIIKLRSGPFPLRGEEIQTEDMRECFDAALEHGRRFLYCFWPVERVH